jgi:DNA-binding transcriptional LysR family regulator
MDLNKTLVFLSVAQSGSFTIAAEELGMTKSKVSRQVKELEEELETQLLHRTTRRLSLTQMGQIFFDNCKPLVSQLLRSEQLIKSQQVEPSGVLRITYPTAMGLKVFSEITNEFIKTHPKVQVEVILSDGAEDLVGKGIDCAIRGGVLEDSSIICRHLFLCERGVFASPEYLERCQSVESPKDLSALNWVSFNTWRQDKIKMIGDEGIVKVALKNQVLNVNSLLFLKQSLVDGVGIGVLPSFLSNGPEMSGELVRVLPNYKMEDIDFYLVYPNTAFLSPALQAFKNFCYQKVDGVLLSDSENPVFSR